MPRRPPPTAQADTPWMLLIHQFPPRPAYLRVKIGRHLQRIGAVAIKNSVYALPRNDETQEDFQWVLREVVKGGGDASIVEGLPWRKPMNAVALLAVVVAATSVTPSPLTLPGADGPVGFDDLRFSAELHKVLVPAGRTGRVDLVDPEKHSIEEIPGFSASGAAGRGHGESTTSADAGGGFIFATDRTQQAVVGV